MLRCWDFSETSQTVSLLLRGYGMLRGLAKGARRERSPFSGGFEPTAIGEVSAIVKDGRELATVTEFALRRVCHAARRSLAAHNAALYLVDLTHHAVHAGDPHPRAFDALCGALDGLERPFVAIAEYAWVLLEEAGYQPRVELDGLSGDGPLGFDPQLGGLTVDPGPAGSRREGPWRVGRATVEALTGLTAGGGVGAEVSERVARLLAAYWTTILGRDLPTRDAIFGVSGVDPGVRTGHDAGMKGSVTCPS